MEFNATHPAAKSPFVVFTIYYSGAADTPLLLSSSSISLYIILFFFFSVYLSVVRYLRYQHLNKTQQKYGRTIAEFSKIDYKDAQAILGSLFLLDSPWVFRQAKDFAFLRVRTPFLTCIVGSV